MFYCNFSCHRFDVFITSSRLKRIISTTNVIRHAKTCLKSGADYSKHVVQSLLPGMSNVLIGEEIKVAINNSLYHRLFIDVKRYLTFLRFRFEATLPVFIIIVLLRDIAYPLYYTRTLSWKSCPS